MNTDIKIQTVKADDTLPVKYSGSQPKKFNGKKLNKHSPINIFFSKKSSNLIIDKQIDYNSINKSLQSMSLSTIPPNKEASLTHIAYIPTTHNSEVLIASLPRSTIFMNEKYERLSMKDIKSDIVKTLLDIPENSIALEQQARGGAQIYNVRFPASKSIQQPIQSIEDTLPCKNIELKTWDSSIVYVKKYFSNLSKEIYNLTYKCSGALCIESNINLLTRHETYVFKKNNNMKAILETISVNKKYNFSIYANSVITGLTKSIYLNFFNIPEDDLKYILKNQDINSLELKQCNAN